MNDLQTIFNRIKDKQKEQKTLKAVYRDVQANSREYQEVLEELKVLKEKKKKLEDGFHSEMRAELDQLDAIKSDIASDREMLSDIALTQLMKGETVGVQDEYENKYEPVFSVRFKKT
jgi:predicted transcriptional regulator